MAPIATHTPNEPSSVLILFILGAFALYHLPHETQLDKQITKARDCRPELGWWQSMVFLSRPSIYWVWLDSFAHCRPIAEPSLSTSPTSLASMGKPAVSIAGSATSEPSFSGLLGATAYRCCLEINCVPRSGGWCDAKT